MNSLHLSFITIIFLFPSLSRSLEAHIVINNNYPGDYVTINKQAIPSYYTTLGDLPSNSLHSSIVILSRTNFSDDCYLSPATNVSRLNGSIAILKNLPFWRECINEAPGVITNIGRLLQQAGCVGVVMPQLEKVLIITSHITF